MNTLLDELDEIVKGNLRTLPKPLPQILDEIYANIEAAIEAAEKAAKAVAEAAEKAEQTAKSARFAAEEAANKAEEADVAVRKAAEAFIEAANSSARKAEKASTKAIKSYSELLLRVESIEQRLLSLEESIPTEEVVVIRQVSRDEARTEIERLFMEGKILYYSDIAKELRLDLELVVDICEELVKEGKVKIAGNS